MPILFGIHLPSVFAEHLLQRAIQRDIAPVCFIRHWAQREIRNEYRFLFSILRNPIHAFENSRANPCENRRAQASAFPRAHRLHFALRNIGFDLQPYLAIGAAAQAIYPPRVYGQAFQIPAQHARDRFHYGARKMRAAMFQRDARKNASGIRVIFRVRSPIAAGLAIGACSHAVGTSKAVELGEVEGAMSGIAIGTVGLVTVLLGMVLS